MLVPNGKLQATLLREGGMITWRHDILDNDTCHGDIRHIGLNCHTQLLNIANVFRVMLCCGVQILMLRIVMLHVVMLSIIMLNAVMLSVVILCVVIPIVVMLIVFLLIAVVIVCHYGKCYYAEYFKTS